MMILENSLLPMWHWAIGEKYMCSQIFLTYNTVYMNDIFPVVLGYWGEKCYNEVQVYFDGLVHERRNFSALAMELRVSSTKPSICLPNTGFVYKHIISAWKHRQFIDRHILSIHFIWQYIIQSTLCALSLTSVEMTSAHGDPFVKGLLWWYDTLL